jgi:hypothetical protein
MIDGETIQSFVPTDSLVRAAITMPRSGAINIKVRIIKKDATIENIAAREIEITEKIERAIEFKELKIDEVDGGDSCKIKLSGIGIGRDLYEGKFLSSIQCKRFCEVYGPLARSDKDIVQCGNSEQVFYKSQELGM